MHTPDTEWEKEDGFIYELKNRIKWDYSYYVSREQSANGYWKRVDSLEQIPPHAISTHRTHPVETTDNLFLHKTYMYLSSRDTYWKERVKKARQAWLRSEIEKLEGMEKDFEVQKDGQYHFGENQKVIGWNNCLTSIITRYKEELEVLESK